MIFVFIAAKRLRCFFLSFPSFLLSLVFIVAKRLRSKEKNLILISLIQSYLFCFLKINMITKILCRRWSVVCVDAPLPNREAHIAERLRQGEEEDMEAPTPIEWRVFEQGDGEETSSDQDHREMEREWALELAVPRSSA